MAKLGRRALVLLVACLSLFVIAACGDDDDDGGGGGGGGGEAKKGGSITISQTSQPDYMDPALTYTVNGIEPLWLVYTPLITYAHEEGQAGAKLIPGLAEDLPEISEDGTDLQAQAAQRLKYSDGSPVKASDFEHAIKRVLNLESGGSAFYLVHRGCAGIPRRRQGRGRHLGHRDRRQDRRHHDHADRAGRLVHARARHVVRGARSERHAVQEHDEGPAPGRRSVHGHRVGAEPSVRDGAEHGVRQEPDSGRARRATSTRSRPRSSSRHSARRRT